MTQLKKRSIWTLLIWSSALVGILIVFFSSGGPTTFLSGEQRVTYSRVIITAGFILYFTMYLLTRSQTSGPIIKDERDEHITRRAYMISFHVILYFTFCCGAFLYWLYKIHKSSTVMPVGWVWVMALSGLCVGFISNSGAILLLDRKMSGHAES
ncbi:MAG: DUF2178 domain-containing protein [Candidatus Aminicenantes bacterium]|nr:DUF2178 domain-containing protein [Candidatus Aminicenantes bacterium]